MAEKYVKKGTQIYLEGRIKTRSYDDADGNRKYITEIVGDQMQLLGRKPDEGSAEGGQAGFPSAAQAPAATAQAPQSDTGGQAQAPKADQGSAGDSADPFDGGNEGPDDLPF